MKKLFLSSSFCDVAQYFEKFVWEKIVWKTVTFIPTASMTEDFTKYVDNDKNAFIELGIMVEELNISDKNQQQIAETLSKNDFIYISGGNTFYLLQELRKSKSDKLIAEHIENGKIYIGSSAGSIVLAPNIEYAEKVDDIKKAPVLTEYSWLGILDFYPLPHYKSEPFTQIIDEIFSDYETKIPVVPISNTQVIEVKGTTRKIIGE